jgi:hypothetical protein
VHLVLAPADVAWRNLPVGAWLSFKLTALSDARPDRRSMGMRFPATHSEAADDQRSRQRISEAANESAKPPNDQRSRQTNQRSRRRISEAASDQRSRPRISEAAK